MNKIGAVITVVVIVSCAYLLLLVVMPIISNLALSANTTMNATSNMSLYPGTSGFLMSTPWILWFLPATIGMAVIVIILKMPSTR